MPPHNVDTYNLPSYFYSCREGGQPMSQLVLVRQDPGNRNTWWETGVLGFCFDIQLQAIFGGQITYGQQALLLGEMEEAGVMVFDHLCSRLQFIYVNKVD